MQLIKYLLKTVCTDMANIMISYVATDIGHKVPEDTPTLNKVGVAYYCLYNNYILLFLCYTKGKIENY